MQHLGFQREKGLELATSAHFFSACTSSCDPNFILRSQINKLHSTAGCDHAAVASQTGDFLGHPRSIAMRYVVGGQVCSHAAFPQHAFRVWPGVVSWAAGSRALRPRCDRIVFSTCKAARSP